PPIASRAQDLFHRLPLAQPIADEILQWPGDSGLIVTLTGGWGEGKTSVKNLVVELLEDRETSPMVIDFNPWLREHMLRYRSEEGHAKPATTVGGPVEARWMDAKFHRLRSRAYRDETGPS